MGLGIGAQDLSEALAHGMVSYVIMVVCGLIYAVIAGRLIQGKVITFLFTASGLFALFVFPYYGLLFLMRDWLHLDRAWGENAIHGASLTIALALLLLSWIVIHWYQQPMVSKLEDETEALKDEDLSQFDKTRRAYMGRKREMTGRGKGL